MDERNLDQIPFPKGQLVKIEGIPFWLGDNTVLLGKKANLELIQKSIDEAKTGIFYGHQFVENEIHEASGGVVLTYILENTPVCPGAITGTIQDAGGDIQTFADDGIGTFTFTSIDVLDCKSDRKVNAGSINYESGVITLAWNRSSFDTSINVDYEHDADSKFPGDDEMSISCDSGRCGELDVFYGHQFVKNETQNNGGGGSRLSYHIVYTPILPGTMTGTVRYGDVTIQTFFANEVGKFTLTDHSIGTRAPKVLEGEIDHATGIAVLQWNCDPGDNSIIVSYEYEIEIMTNPVDYSKFPGDEMSIAQGDPYGGCCNLDIFYNHQFIENETLIGPPQHRNGHNQNYAAEHSPILQGTMTGTVCYGDVAIQNFVADEVGKLTFSDIPTGLGAPKILEGKVDYIMGLVMLKWNCEPGDNSIIVSYEYDFR